MLFRSLCAIRRTKSPRTTRSARPDQCPEDLVNRHFSAMRFNELWVANLTYVRTFSVAYFSMMKNFNKQYADYMESSNYVNGVIVEYVERIEVIKAFNQSSTSYEKFSKSVESFKDYTLNWYKSVWKLMNFGNSVLPSIINCCISFCNSLYFSVSVGDFFL